MIIVLVLSCFMHKTSLSGVVDCISENNCTIVLENTDMVIINSKACKDLKEGDVISFYVRKK